MKIEKIDQFDYPLRSKDEIMKDLEKWPKLEYELEV